MSSVWSCNEWDPLEEVIIGTAINARFPHADPSTRLAEYPDRRLDQIPQGPFPQHIIEEAEEDLEAFAAVLRSAGALGPMTKPLALSIGRPPVTITTARATFY
jgi:hypothetical protein